MKFDWSTLNSTNGYYLCLVDDIANRCLWRVDCCKKNDKYVIKKNGRAFDTLEEMKTYVETYFDFIKRREDYEEEIDYRSLEEIDEDITRYTKLLEEARHEAIAILSKPVFTGGDLWNLQCELDKLKEYFRKQCKFEDEYIDAKAYWLERKNDND